MTGRQASAARTLLGWSFEQLAQKSGVPVSSVYLLMRLGKASCEHDYLIQVAFEQEGIKFFLPPAETMIDISGKVVSVDVQMA